MRKEREEERALERQRDLQRQLEKHRRKVKELRLMKALFFFLVTQRFNHVKFSGVFKNQLKSFLIQREFSSSLNCCPLILLCIRVRINGLHFKICEAAIKLSLKLQGSFDSEKRKLRHVIFSSYDQYYSIKRHFYTALMLFESLHENV